jgi:hypothetical protein
MRSAPLFLLASVALLASASCDGGTTAEGTGYAGTGAGSQSSSSGGTTTTSTSSSTSASSSSGVLAGKSLTISLEPFTVPAGEEVYKCQNFANPFGGGDVDVQTFESHMAMGSHHMLLFYKNGVTDGALEDCSGLEFAATPYSTQLPDDELSFPDGVAARIPSTTGLRVQSHYLNTTGSPINAHVVVTFHFATPGTVTQHAGVLFVVDPNLSVPAQSTKVISKDCAIPLDMNLIKAGSHMHKHGTDFVATAAGQTIFHTTTWDDPAPAKFDPPVALHAGDPLHFACTFKNDGATPLKFGESASTDEMCIFVGSFYPVPDGVATVTCN